MKFVVSLPVPLVVLCNFLNAVPLKSFNFKMNSRVTVSLLFLYFHVLAKSWCALPKKTLITIPSLGQIRGLEMISAAGKPFYAYRGIPYAKPPVGELRFRVRALESL